MYNAPTEHLNAIAKTPMRSKAMQTLFALSTEQRKGQQERQAKGLAAQGYDPVVILSYQMTWPLWTENKSISAYIQKTQNTDLRMTLPEITSMKEAMLLAQTEWMLSPSQMKQLKQLLSPS